MAQINNQPLLSLCIPIYNRLAYLERQLARMLEDKDLFDEQIQLIISDNCSTDDLRSCCDKYHQQGLKLLYHCQDTNIGPDGNFDWCFHHANGKYVWLLGSDDIPQKGVLTKLLNHLTNNDYGLVHLAMQKRECELTILQNSNDMAATISYWITYMSANIIRTESLNNLDLSKYLGSYIIQVPAYLNACCSYPNNAIVYLPSFFEIENDTKNNGGLNLFEVFVKNLFGIYESFIKRGMLSVEAFERIKKVEFKEFLSCRVVWVLILKRDENYFTEGSWRTLWKYYGTKAYAYYYIIYMILRELKITILLGLRKVLLYNR